MNALRGMVKLGTSPQARRFEALSEHMIEALSPGEVIKTLHPLAPEYLVQLSMVYGRYAEAIRQFDHHDYVELALVAAFYAMVGRMLDAMAVPLDAEVANYQPKLK